MVKVIDYSLLQQDYILCYVHWAPLVKRNHYKIANEMCTSRIKIPKSYLKFLGYRVNKHQYAARRKDTSKIKLFSHKKFLNC